MGSPCTWLALKLFKKRLVVRANVSIQTILDPEKETECLMVVLSSLVVMRTLLVLGKSI